MEKRRRFVEADYFPTVMILHLVARTGYEFLNREERPVKDMWKPARR